MPEHNKVLARRMIEEVWNQGKVVVVDELIARGAIFHDPNIPDGLFTEPDGYKKYVSIYRSAFPDLHFTIHDQVAEGEKVVTRWEATGTNNGPLMGVAATHNHVTLQGMDIYRYENGKIVEGWIVYDMLGLLQQLGVEPLDGRRSTGLIVSLRGAPATGAPHHPFSGRLEGRAGQARMGSKRAVKWRSVGACSTIR